VAGADGSGKSTQARELVERMRRDGVRARRVWLRHPRLLSTPFLALARLRGQSRYEVVDGVRHGYWEFSGSWLMSTIFPWALLVDAWVFALIKVYAPLVLLRSHVVCDRFALDTLVDLRVGVRDPVLDTRRPGRLFLSLVPSGSAVVVLDLASDLAVARTPDLVGDRARPARRSAYLEVAARHGYPVISAAPPPEQVTASLVEAIAPGRAELDEPEQRVAYYSVSNRPGLRWLLRHKSIALACHWLFQGLLYMDRSERRFKLALDVLLAVAIAVPLQLVVNPLVAWIVAALCAHTANFLLNGQVWVVLKHFDGVRHSPSEFAHEVDRLRARVAREPSIAYAAAYGSMARGEWRETSDLDLRLVRVPGIRAALRACWFATRARAEAFVRGFPLDVYVLDEFAGLDRMAEKDTPIVLTGVGPGRSS
jgi:thymidylate kinase/predicted nucleotidyltransferase